VQAQLPTTPKFAELLSAYYGVRGLDDQGTAKASTLSALGLEREAEQLGLKN
jgi:hypothetical protein